MLPLDGSLQADVIQRGTPPNAEGVNPRGIRVFTPVFQWLGSPISTSPSLSLIAFFVCWSYEIPMEGDEYERGTKYENVHLFTPVAQPF